MLSRTNYQPTSVAHFKLAHTFWAWNYDNVTVTIGAGSETSPLWSRVILTGLERESLTVDMAVDLTDAAAYMPPSAVNRWWIKVSDSSREDIGILSTFQIKHNGTNYDTAVVMPLTGPFFSGSFYAYIPAGESASTNYYVNDGSITGDQYCTAIGDDANTGLTPAAPKRTIQAIIDRYALKAGDAVWIDAGLYALTNDVQLTQLDRGTNGNPIRFVGVTASNGEPATILDRGASGGACFTLNGGVRFIQLENFWLKGGYNGINFDGSWEYYTDGLTIKNTRVSNTAGDAIYLYEAGGVELLNCRVHNFGSYGLNVRGSSAVLNQSVIAASTNQIAALVYESSSYYGSGSSLLCSNSVLYASGAGGRCALLAGWLSGGTLPAYSSCLFATNGATVGLVSTAGNLFLDPLFANPANADFHLKSTAGRWDPQASSGAGAFLNDAVNSSLIDAGDPATTVALEPSPNGGRVNIGAFGGTAYESKSPSVRYLTLIQPVAGSTNFGLVTVSWNTYGAGWQLGDTVRLEFSADGGTNFTTSSGGNALAFENGGFTWDARELAVGTNYLLRLTCNQDASVQALSSRFAIGAFQNIRLMYFVNDSTTVGDVYSTAVGNNTNDALTPATPKASVQAILDAYDLEGGDIVFIDTGVYTLTNTITVGVDDSGSSANNPVRLVGSTNVAGSILSGEGAVSSVVTLAGCSYVALENLQVKRASSFGIYLSFAPECMIKSCRVYTNGYGIYFSRSSSGTVQNSLVDANTYSGIYISGSSSIALLNNTLVGNGGSAVSLAYGGYGSSASLRNNIVWALGAGRIGVSSDGSSLNASDYNLFYATDGAAVGSYANTTRPTLGDWQAATGQEQHSLSADPLFVDRDGADNVLGTGDDDYHLQSTGGSWHGGTFTADASDSPCVDAGDPTTPVDAEPAPNGARINLGAFGGTAQASKSPAGRALTVVSPNGGEVWSGAHDILWIAPGQSWTTNDSVKIEYSSDGGTNWVMLAGALPFNAGKFTWNTIAAPSGAKYRVRVTSNANPSAQDASDGLFTIHNTSLAYFVNDSSTTNDMYCAAAGSDANDGLSPATPKSSVQAILDSYDLEPGDTVYVDTGSYLLMNNVFVSARHSGSPTGWVRLIGSTKGTVFNRQSSNYYDRCLEVHADYFWVEGMRLTGAQVGLSFNVDTALNAAIVGNVIYGNQSAGLEIRYYSYGTGQRYEVRNNLLYDNGGGMSLVGGYYANAEFLVTQNTIVCTNGTGLTVIGSPVTSKFTGNLVIASGNNSYCLGSATLGQSDFNLFWTRNAGRVASFYYFSGYIISSTLGEWQRAIGMDMHSLMAEPLFADEASGDFHLKSTGGRWNPTTDSFVADVVDSPAIDAGDPVAAVGAELSPNGNRLNLGAYGGTAQASKSPAGRALTVVSPNGGEVWSGARDILWIAPGQGWATNDTVKVEYSSDGGANWVMLVGALPFNAGKFTWNTTAAPSGAKYRARVTSNANPNAQDASDADFTVHNNGLNFYVNDPSTTNDVYCTAVGNDANDGLSPATPKVSVQAIPDTYDLEPGDTVYVDTGSYLLTNSVVVAATDGGSSNGWVRFIGSANGTVFNRQSNTYNSRCLEVHADYVWVESFTFVGAYAGLSVNVDTCKNATLVRNIAHGNLGFGIEIKPYNYGQGTRYELRNNLLYANGGGMSLSADYHGNWGEFVVLNNTVEATNGTGIGVSSTYGGGTIKGNIILASGPSSCCLLDIWDSVHHSDFNLFQMANGAGMAQRIESGYITNYAKLSDWLNRTGTDAHSLSADPLFADSASGDFHLKSSGGRWHPASGMFVADAVDSPAIDAGDPAAGVGTEVSPNGNRLNLGAYAGTAEASKSPASRTITLIAPNGGEVWRGIRLVRWNVSGQAWQSSNSLTLSYSADSGTNWSVIPGGASVPTDLAQFTWNLSSLAPGNQYRVRLVCNQDAGVSASSASDFTVQAGGVYFVNDGYDSLNDLYCTTAGSNTYDGLTASTPKHSLQAILETYDLEPGDTVFVDAGVYAMTNDIVVASTNGGSAAGTVHILGVKGKTILDRGAANAPSTCLMVSASHVTVENLTCRNAYYGIQVTASDCSLLDNFVFGCGYNGIYINRVGNSLLAHNLVVHSGAGAAVALEANYLGGGDYASVPCSLINNTVLATNADAISITAGGGPQLRNNIVQVSGSNHYCVSARDITAISISDHNDLFPKNGAGIGKVYQATAADLFEWRALTSWDAHSLSVDPLFANSTNGDFHLKSAAGRFDPSAGLPPTDPSAWVNDATTSLAIDAGDLADAVGDESLPNGGRINLGAFGGTTEASRSSTAARIVNVLSPNGGEVWSGFRAVELRAAGTGLLPTDTLRLEYSGDGGANWQPVSGGSNIPSTQTRFWWDTRAATNGFNYIVRATVVQSTNVQDTSDTVFRIANLVAPQILAQPQSYTVLVGNSVTFTVTPNDTILLSYQWRKNGTNIAGATSATLNLNDVTTDNAGNYAVVVANPAGAVISDPAILTVITSPSISILTSAQATNGEFQFQLLGFASSVWVIQASTNLGNWTPLSTNIIPQNGILLITDPAVMNYSRRFYRALAP